MFFILFRSVKSLSGLLVFFARTVRGGGMYRINSGFLVQLVNALEGEGLDSARLCQEAGINLALLRQPDSFVRRASLYRLMALAQSESNDPDIGLRTYRYVLPGAFQLLGYIMMSSQNLNEALSAMARYLPLLGTGIKCGLSQEEGGQRFWGIEEPEELLKPRSFEDAGLAVMLGFCRWLTGGSLPGLQEIAFTYPEPLDTTEHQRLFGCALRFGEPRFSILFDQQDLLRPLSTANETLALLHGNFADHRMEQLREATYSSRTRTWLIENFSLGDQDMASVAMGIGVSPRALQRGLVREKTSFREVLDGARRQLADYYLRHTPYSQVRVGELLGFKEPSSFHKACLRWFGTTPGRYRNSLNELAR